MDRCSSRFRSVPLCGIGRHINGPTRRRVGHRCSSRHPPTDPEAGNGRDGLAPRPVIDNREDIDGSHVSEFGVDASRADRRPSGSAAPVRPWEDRFHQPDSR